MALEWIALNAIKGLGPVKINNLLRCYGTPEEILKQPVSSLAPNFGLSQKIASEIKSASTFSFAEKQLKIARESGVRIITLHDKEYPPALKQIFAPPPVLYVRGDIDVFSSPAVAVVGTRKFSHYGRRATQELVSGLSRKGIVTVSGMAHGIDSVAHKTCMDCQQKTVAVLGSGVDYIYPSENRDLAKRIENNGALISEFPLRMHPEAFNFPRRNRIISGLSAGIIVVEAGRKSGALITASYALQQQREVFAVPGSIFSDKSEGTFNLIKNGATPVRVAEDIIEAIEVIRQRVSMNNVPKATQPSLDLLSESERIVLNQLSGQPLRLDQIVERTQKIMSELFNVLLNLELKGLVKQVAGQQYVKM